MSEQLTNEQIDWLVARNIMRWGSSAANGISCWNIPRSDNYGEVVPKTSWQPSTRIADAWQVLEKFAQNDDIFLKTEGDGWLCLISADNNKDYIAEDKSAPRAICLAALKAVGVSHAID